MRRVLGQQENIAGLERRQLTLVVFDVMKIEIAFELIKNLIARIDVKILAAVGAAGDESDKVLVLPDDPALAPVAAVFIDPLFEIETL